MAASKSSGASCRLAFNLQNQCAAFLWVPPYQSTPLGALAFPVYQVKQRGSKTELRIGVLPLEVMRGLRINA